jgi:hypothetical protein
MAIDPLATIRQIALRLSNVKRNQGVIAFCAIYAIVGTLQCVRLLMSLGRHAFKLNDAARLVRALKAAGLSISRVELDNGKVIAVTDNAATPVEQNEWDEHPKAPATKKRVR